MTKSLWIAVFSGMLLLSIFLASAVMAVTIPGPNRPPIARTGMDRIVEPYEMVKLDGSNSYDPDGDKLTYQWNLLAVPEGGQAKLTGAQGMATCCFTPNREGAWVIGLQVSDSRLNSERDVMIVRVKAASPAPTQPDFAITHISASGIYEGKYFKNLRVKIENKGLGYAGPLSFRIIGLDRLIGGKFTFDRTVTIEDLCLTPQGDEKWITLIHDQVEWPNDVPTITFGVSVDPENRLAEANEKDNFKERTIYRNQLLTEAEPPSPPTQPDFVVLDLDAAGIYQEKYLNTFRVKIKNKGLDYSGPLDFTIYVLHKAVQVFHKDITIDQVCLAKDQEKWLSLLGREIEWPEEMLSLNFRLDVDRQRKVPEADEQNNSKSSLIYRGQLLPSCNVVLSKTLKIRDYHARMYSVQEGEGFVFDCRDGNKFDFGLTLRDFCHQTPPVELRFVYDYTPLKADGENIKLKEGSLSFSPGGETYVMVHDLQIPRKTKFAQKYVTFAILRCHEKGYDVLYSTKVKIRMQ
jgi:hypothetical protein